MTHETIQARGLVEAYVRRSLTAEEKSAFEEHYFQCDQCFSDVEAMEKFVAGVRAAGARGLLDTRREPSAAAPGWWRPAFALATAAALILAAALSYVTLVRLPLQQARLDAALAQARENAERATQLDQRASLDAVPQANVPVAILMAERSPDSSSQLVLDSKTRQAMLWIDVPQEPVGAGSIELTISAADQRYSKAIRGLERNTNGALALTLPANELAAGAYVVTLYRERAPTQMIARYRVNIVRN